MRWLQKKRKKCRFFVRTVRGVYGTFLGMVNVLIDPCALTEVEESARLGEHDPGVVPFALARPGPGTKPFAVRLAYAVRKIT